MFLNFFMNILNKRNIQREKLFSFFIKMKGAKFQLV